ncbi:MAG: hypothetical protein JWN34_5136, partial [Bryobacterales bacterium]|nr:hypothetical protein [Bryobacterales bacterium]
MPELQTAPPLSEVALSEVDDRKTRAFSGAGSTLQALVNSPEARNAVVPALLGRRTRRTVRVNGADVSIAQWMRMLSRASREAAEQSETGLTGFPRVEAEAESPAQDQFTQTGGPPVLIASVGRAGKNDPVDVRFVQQLLNANLPVPSPAVSENGVIDAPTIQAIENYQRKVLGRSPDGRIDPKGITLLSLAADKLAFLPHSCAPLSGGPAIAVDATSMNPGFLTPVGVIRASGLQQIVDRRILTNHPRLRRLRFSLVDLTGAAKLANPQFSGHRDLEQGGLGSMAKQACMYAAYQLKFDLEVLSRQQGIRNQTTLFNAARKLWNDAQKPDLAHVTTLFPAGPKVDQVGKLITVDGKPLPAPRTLSSPNLERLFDAKPAVAGGGMTVQFKGSDFILVDPSVTPTPPHTTTEVRSYIRAKGENLAGVRKLSFAERLFLMIDESDNAAAQSCIEDVSVLYIASVLWQSDLYRPERGGGLWEASTHRVGGQRWIKPPVPRGSRGTDFVSATAASIAALLTLMEQGRLTDRNASAGMKHLTSKLKSGVPGGSHTRSYFLEGLAPLFT